MSFWTLASALWYLQSRSFVNSVKARLRRLRQPKYLIGALLGGLYLIFFVGRSALGWSLMRRGRPPSGVGDLSADLNGLSVGENFGAALLLLFLLSGWVFSKDRAALIFTEAEVTNLFPAPLSRQMLLLYRLLRGQATILFWAILMLFFTGRLLLGFRGLMGMVGWWMILSVVSLHGLGASFAVQRLTERGMSGWWRRGLTVAFPLGVVGALWFWYQAMPASPGSLVPDRDGVEQWTHFAHEVFRSGPAPWLLWPFRLMVRPLFAVDMGDGLLRCLPAAALLVLHGWWVMRSAVSFEEASLDLSRRMSDLRTAAQSGQVRLVKRKRTGELFALAPLGPRWVALWWSGLIESGATPRRWALVAGVTVLGIIAVPFWVTDPVAPIFLGIMSAGIAAVMVMLGGQSAAQRFARALRDLDVVKAFPVAGWELYLGTVMGGLTSLVLLEWLLLTAALVLVPMGGEGARGELAVLVGGWAVGLILMPVASVFFAIPVSVGFVLFPGWFASGTGRPQGIEATGQRMLVGLAQLATLLLAAVPIALVSVPVFFGVQWLSGPRVAGLLAAVAATCVLAVEAALGVWWIGRRFEGLDAAEEQ